MKMTESTTAVCDRCGKIYTGRAAISREDNHTLICSDCGTREALSGIGISEEEQEKILQIIHQHTKASDN